MEDLDNHQFREERVGRGGRRAIQSLNVTARNIVGSDESARTKHFLSVFTDAEKEWLIKTDKEERGRGRGFMKRIKEKWDAKYPNRNNVSAQNLRNNAVRFRLEMNETNTTNEIQQEMVDQNRNTNNANAAKTNNKWTNEMTLELLKIDREETSNRRGFMKGMKERWDNKYPGLPVTAQCLRENTARIGKNKALFNLLEVQDQSETVNNANHAAAIPGHEDQIEAANRVTMWKLYQNLRSITAKQRKQRTLIDKKKPDD